jgi:hypothetical protein
LETMIVSMDLAWFIRAAVLISLAPEK